MGKNTTTNEEKKKSLWKISKWNWSSCAQSAKSLLYSGWDQDHVCLKFSLKYESNNNHGSSIKNWGTMIKISSFSQPDSLEVLQGW